MNKKIETIKKKAEQILNVLQERELEHVAGISRYILAREYLDSNDAEQNWEELLDEFDYVKKIQKVFPVDMEKIINKIQKIIDEETTTGDKKENSSESQGRT
jgi:uncharacterized protein (DUF2344 family)